MFQPPMHNLAVNFFFGKNKFRRAFEKGFASDSIGDALKELDDAPPKSCADAEAICWALQQIQSQPPAIIARNTYSVSRLFQDVEDVECGAIPVLHEQGIPLLLALFDQIHALQREEDVDCLLFLLKIFAMFPTTEGTLKVIEAANEPLKPDGYMWSVILGSFGPGHPEAELLFRSLSDPLPPGFIAVSLLDAANTHLIADATFAHPFDNKAGKERLKGWLTETDPEKFSYAIARQPLSLSSATEEAKALLIECLQRVLVESKTATGSDKKLYEKWFQNHRSTYLRLFPGEADKLAAHELPSSTLQSTE